MFEIIGRFVVSHRRRILAVGLLALLAFAFLGSRAGSRLKSAGFTSPSAPSQVASDRLRSQFGGSVNFILVVTARTGSVDDPAAATAGASLAARLAAAPHVTSVNSYWTSGHPSSLRSRDGRQALVTASITGSDTQVTSRARYLTGLLTSGGAGGPGGSPAISVAAGGAAPAGAQIASQINSDLAKAEGIAVPVTLVLLLFAFGSVVAASLPLAIGVLSIFATLAVLYLLSLVTDVSVYALNLTTALGLGLGIDYSLLMVGRFREELGRGAEPDDAVVATVATAGRTIVFSGAAVAAALAALTVFPLYFLRSFAYAGMSVVAVAVLAALLVLPSILAVLGRRVNALPVPFLARLRAGRGGPAGGGESRGHRRPGGGPTRGAHDPLLRGPLRHPRRPGAASHGLGPRRR
jgi:RND superfamily putative drug exporter